MDTEYCVVLCTCPNQEIAGTIGEHLVAERLAACVNLVPGLTSIYRWQGEVQRDSEVLLLIKTEAARFAELGDALRRLHPYEVPEIIALPIAAGSPDYLSWITQCTRSND